jgi:hypothetical protein
MRINDLRESRTVRNNCETRGQVTEFGAQWLPDASLKAIDDAKLAIPVPNLCCKTAFPSGCPFELREPIRYVGNAYISRIANRTDMRDSRVIRSRHLHKLQRRHFIIFDVLPFLGTSLAIG